MLSKVRNKKAEVITTSVVVGVIASLVLIGHVQYKRGKWGKDGINAIPEFKQYKTIEERIHGK